MKDIVRQNSRIHQDMLPNKILFIRHAKSINNELNSKQYSIISGQDNCELSDIGIQELKCLNLADIDGFDIYTSPAKRCMETCNILFRHKKINISNLLLERSLGIWEGMSIAELEKDITISPELKKQLKSRIHRHSFSFRLPTAENYVDVEARCQKFLRGLSSDKNIIIVSHLTTIRCFLKILLNLSEQQCLSLCISNIEPIYVNKCIHGYNALKPLKFFV